MSDRYRIFYDEKTGNISEIREIFDISGVPLDPYVSIYPGDPEFDSTLSDVRSCQTEHNECVKWKSLIVGIDNTGSRFNHDYTLLVTLSDGSTHEIFQTATSGWTPQLNQWIGLFQAINPEWVVEARCNIPGGCGGLLEPNSDVNFEKMRWRYLNITACPTEAVPVKVEIVESSVPSYVGRFMDLEYTTTPEKRGYICLECGAEPTLYYQNGEIVSEADKPVCYFVCAEDFPSVPEPLVQCTTYVSELCDVVSGTPTPFHRSATVCVTEDQTVSVTLEDTVEDPRITDPDLITSYVVQGDIGSCGMEISSNILCDECGNKIEVVQYDDGAILYYEYNEKGGRGELTFPAGALGKCEEEEDCGEFTGDCRCYGEQSSGNTYEYVNSDNATEGTFSTNTTTLKWEVNGGDGSLDGSIPYIDDCINGGGIATLEITDVEGNVVIFSADSIIASGPDAATYGGVGPGGFSGKVREVSITCSLTSSDSGKACSRVTCEGVVEWVDTVTGDVLTPEQVETLVECTIPVSIEPECEEQLIQIQACAAEEIPSSGEEICEYQQTGGANLSNTTINADVFGGVVQFNIGESDIDTASDACDGIIVLNLIVEGTPTKISFFSSQWDTATGILTYRVATNITCGTTDFLAAGHPLPTLSESYQNLIDAGADPATGTVDQISVVSYECWEEQQVPVGANVVDLGDLILTLATRDCEGVILNSTQYNLSAGNLELTQPVLTTDCSPEPDVTQTEECILDAARVKWTEITIVQGTAITVIYVNQDTLQLGTPEGAPSEWTSCVNQLCDPPKDETCYYIEKEAAIRPFGDPPNFDGLSELNSFAGSTLDGFICGTWETTNQTFGSAPLRFPPGVTNWFVTMFNSGSGLYANTMRLNMWAKQGCILESYIRMTDMDPPNGANEGEIYNVSKLHGYSRLTEYQFTGSPAYYPLGTYNAVPLNTDGQLQANGDYVPSAGPGLGLQAIYSGGFNNQIISARTDQGGQSVVWMYVRYLAPLRTEIDCDTGEVTYWDDYAYDEQNPYDVLGQPVLTSVQVSEEDVVSRPCCQPDPKPINDSFDPFSDCDVEATMVIRCVDGDQTVQDIEGNDIMLLDNDEIAYNTLTCDGTVIGFSIVAINDSTVQIALPAPAGPEDPDVPPFNTKNCVPGPEILGPSCKVDESGVIWNEYMVVSVINGTTLIYVDESGATGTPDGNVVPCPESFIPTGKELCYEPVSGEVFSATGFVQFSQNVAGDGLVLTVSPIPIPPAEVTQFMSDIEACLANGDRALVTINSGGEQIQWLVGPEFTGGAGAAISMEIIEGPLLFNSGTVDTITATCSEDPLGGRACAFINEESREVQWRDLSRPNTQPAGYTIIDVDRLQNCTEDVQVPTVDCGVAEDYNDVPLVSDTMLGVDEIGNDGIGWWGLASLDGNAMGDTGPFNGQFPWVYTAPNTPASPYPGFRWMLSQEFVEGLGCPSAPLSALTIRYTITPLSDRDADGCDWLFGVTRNGGTVDITPMGPGPYGGPFFGNAGYCYNSTVAGGQQVHEAIVDPAVLTGLTLSNLTEFAFEVAQQSQDQIQVDNVEFIAQYDNSNCPAGTSDVPLMALCGDEAVVETCSEPTTVRKLGHVTVGGADNGPVPVCIIPEPQIETIIETVCVSGNQPPYNDGDQIWTILTVKDGVPVGTSLVDPNTGLPITQLIVYGPCPTPPTTDTELVRCVEDENGVQWDEFTPIVGGVAGTPFYINKATGNIGTPAGAITTCTSSDISDYGDECLVSGEDPRTVLGVRDRCLSEQINSLTTDCDGEDSLRSSICNIEFPSIDVWDGTLEGASQTVGGLGSYTTQVEALPVAFPADYIVPTKLIETRNSQTYYQGDGNFGTVSVEARVALPSSYVQRSEFVLQDMDVLDQNGYVEYGSDGTGYTTEIEAMPVAFPAGHIPHVRLARGTRQPYAGCGDAVFDASGNMNYSSLREIEVDAIVGLPASYVMPVQTPTKDGDPVPLSTVIIAGEMDVWDASAQQSSVYDPNSYTTEVDAVPVAPPAGVVFPVRVTQSQVEYYQGNGCQGPGGDPQGGDTQFVEALRVTLPLSHKIRTEQWVGPGEDVESNSNVQNINAAATGALISYPAAQGMRDLTIYTDRRSEFIATITLSNGDVVIRRLFGTEDRIQLEYHESPIVSVRVQNVGVRNARVIVNALSRQNCRGAAQ